MSYIEEIIRNIGIISLLKVRDFTLVKKIMEDYRRLSKLSRNMVSIPSRSGELPTNFHGKGVKTQQDTSRHQPAPSSTQPLSANELSSYEITTQPPNDIENKSQGIADNQPQKTNILQQIGHFLVKIIMFPIILLRVFFSWLVNLISSYCNKQTDQTSHAEISVKTPAIPEDLNITDNSEYKGNILTKNESCSLYDDDEEYFSCQDDNSLQGKEDPLPQQNSYQEHEKDVACEEKHSQPQTAEDLATYKSTGCYQKSIAKTTEACYKFFTEQLFETFYEIYAFNTKLNNKEKKHWFQKSWIVPKIVLQVAMETKKQKILTELEQLYDGVFDSIFDSVKLEELQQKQSAVELTEIKINQLFENVCSAQVTHDDYELVAHNYLPLMETLSDIDRVLKELFTIVANENKTSLDEKIKHTKAITIAFLFYNMDISREVLKDYLDLTVKT